MWSNIIKVDLYLNDCFIILVTVKYQPLSMESTAVLASEPDQLNTRIKEPSR